MSPACPQQLDSALYEGTLTHWRSEPAHRFRRRIALPLLFLDELAAVSKGHPLADLDPERIPSRVPAGLRLRREDFLPGPEPTLHDAVAHALSAAGAARPAGRIAMLGHVRTWGWLFNPLTVYYCFDHHNESVERAVLEVTNTPWHERCRYVVGPPGRHTFAKRMHVSPFLPDSGTYVLRYSEPGETLRVDLAATSGEGDPPEVVRATISLQRRPLDRSGLARLLWGYPAQTLRVSTGIYGQALRLWGRGATVHPHPETSHNATERQVPNVMASRRGGCRG